MPLTARPPTQHLVDLVGALGGSWHGYVATARCPAHTDRTPSLSIRQGDRGILVTCFAGCSPQDILRELHRIPLRQRFDTPKADLRRTGNVKRLWDQALSINGTLAERYLQGRYIAHGPADLRFHPRCPLGPKPRTVFRPALLVGVRESRRLVAFQRIFIDPASGRYDCKVMLGQPGQGAWQGYAPAGDILAIAEGFETAAAFTAIHGVPCWASLGARRLDQLRLPSGVETLLIAEDNDPEGASAANRAEAHYARPDLTIRRAPPPKPLKDWALVLERERERGGGSRG
ncbi:MULTISPECIES: DUF7146 domain-containing protein [Sphingomonas]|jgi:hypothetical protein|uniref:Virulence-associated protein E n=1 Tax=Sphingomonas aracearum TaxID=2283317 RepID=A0A369VRU6_9SPHN|nr:MULTISPECIES: toprim domain-containing protein [Sphingomonas]MCH4894321.1 virulence-associated protein E [Sphingomonas sp. SFZ2018-12]RDE04227.1 virulence-associated protein E [Sphingomonas aracearum]